MPPELVARVLIWTFPVLVIYLVLLIAAGVFYLYRLEKIPGLSVNQALAVLFLCRILDAGSF